MSFVSYAQNFEDVMLWRALGHVKDGRYVDVGAQHPETDSVSRALYERGWRGVHVEPVPEYAAALRRERPDELVLEVAVAAAPGTCRLHVFRDTGLSTVSDEYASRHAKERGLAGYTTSVPAMSLTEVFAAARFAQTHWLKIDVEGAEREVIEGWDATRHRPWLVLVESTVPLSTVDDSQRWMSLLGERGYVQVYFDGLNRWFVREESRDLAAAFSAPPNCFDDFVTARELRLRRELDRANDELAQAHRRQQAATPPHDAAALLARPTGASRSNEAIGAMKLQAQEFGRTGRIDAAEALLQQVLEDRPDDAEALGLLAIIDSERGRHVRAIERGLRAAQISRWGADVLNANLATFIRRAAHHRERVRVLCKSLPVRLRQAATPAEAMPPSDSYDVIVLHLGAAAGGSRFEGAFAIQRTGAGRTCRLDATGSLQERVRAVLELTDSDVLVFVHEDDVPLAAFEALVTALQRPGSADWAFGRAIAVDASAPSAETAYGRYREQVARLSGLPSLEFALFERSDVTGGAIGVRRSALDRLVDGLPDLPFSIRSLAIHAALEFSPAFVAVDVLARPASAFERDFAACGPALERAFRRLLANAAANTNAPMPREWGVLAWSLPVDQGGGRGIDARHWDELSESVAALQREPMAGRRHRGVNFVGMPLGISGLAENMRAFVHAADLARLPSCIGDLGVPQKPEQSDLRLLHRLRDRLPYRTSVVFANPDILYDCWPEQLRGTDRYRIGYWFWEADRLPGEWSYAFDLVEEIWVATEFVREAVVRSTDKPVVVMPYPIQLEVRAPRPKAAFGLAEDVFWFLVTFDFNSFMERKNPRAAIGAFRTAFPGGKERVGLLIKTINGAARAEKMAELRALIEDDPRIVLRDEAMPRDDVVALLNAADCYVSLHRSEGLGLGLAESMYLGKPVVGTGYSGNLDFMNSDNSCLVRHRLVPVAPGEYPHSKTNDFHWAEADVEHAAHHLRRIYADQAFRQAISGRAGADIRARFDPIAVGERMRRRLREVGVR